MGQLFSLHRTFPVTSCVVLGLVTCVTQGVLAQPKPDSSADAQQPRPQEVTEGISVSPPTNAESKESLSTSEPSSEDKEADKIQARLADDSRRREAWRVQNASTGLPKRADVLALTVSGGVSLGSYEAGQLHILTEALRRSPGSAKLKVVTGASAGSANAIIAGTDSCQAKIELPEESLGYRVWVENGLKQLFDPKRVTSQALFVRDGLRSGYEKIQETWQKGLPEQCDFVFGVAVTRERGYEVDLAPGLVVPRQAERFVVRVQGRGSTTAPRFENYLDPFRSFERPLLPLSSGRDPTAKTDTAAIWQLVSASAAFPIAFSPQPIEHCTTAPRGKLLDAPADAPPQCEVATRVDAFVDGGVFDNNPLGTAYDVASNGLYEDGEKTVFRPVPTGGAEAAPEVVFGYIDPDLRNYTIYEPPVSQRDDKHDPMLDILARLGGQVLSSARGRELATFAERHPEALTRLWTLEASYPPVSELMAAFFGFFEQDFRDFDFHLGSYDTFRDLRDNSGTMLGVDPFLDGIDRHLEGGVKNIPKRYQKLGCILAYTEPDRYSGLGQLCTGKDMRNFRILLQVTIDRLWSNCRRLTDDEVSDKRHLQCKRARGGIAPPQVDPSFKTNDTRFKLPSESEFDYTMRLLTDYQFYFKDLGLKAPHAKKGRLAIRRQLAEMVHALSNAQPGFAARTMVLTAGRTMVNGIEYEPPPRRWIALLGTSVSIGYLHQISQDQPFFWNPEFRQHSIRTLLTDGASEFSATLSMGVEWALLPLSGSIFQSSVGVRGGYQFAANDAIGVNVCNEDSVQDDSRKCSQPVIHVPLNLTLLERVRLSFMPIFYPMPQSWGHKFMDFELGLGGEFF